MSLQDRANPSHLVLTGLPPSSGRGPSVREAAEHHAQVLLKAHQDGHPDAAALLRSHGLAKGSNEEILGASLSDELAHTLVAKEHGYKDWEEVVRNGDLRIDPRFEAAVDAVVDGNLGALQTLLKDSPDLAHARSSYPHHSTLLHHCSANGIEHTRQWQSPANAPDIARELLAAGADPDAICDVYRGGYGTTPLCLLCSSSPPALAGVQDALVEVLCKGGAKPDGLEEVRPMWTAILFGYPLCVERLASCGARLDNVIFAAALGNLDLVKKYVAGGPEKMASPRSVQRIGTHGPVLAPDRMLEYALIYSSGHGRRDVVEFLLSKDLDLTFKEPMWGSTALGMVRYHRDLNGRADEKQAVITLLERARRRLQVG